MLPTGKIRWPSIMRLFYQFSIRNSSPLLVVPKSVIRACLNFDFLEEWILFGFWWVIASYCELKTDKRRLEKNKRLQAVVKLYIERANDWFGLHDNVVSISRIYTIKVLPKMGKPDNGHLFSIKPWKCKENLCISGCSLIFLFKYLGHSDSRFYLCKKRKTTRWRN